MGDSQATLAVVQPLTRRLLVSPDPPSEIAELEDAEVDVGSPVWLKCSSMGNPRPQYEWDYYRSENVVQENDDGVSRLLIHNATARNTGSYTCHARNDRGRASKTVRVHVKGGITSPRLFFFFFLARIDDVGNFPPVT